MNEYPWESMKIVKAVPGEPVEIEVTGIIASEMHSQIVGHVAGYPVTQDMLQHLKWANEYKAQGKRYPRPRKRRSKARMSRQWRDRA